MTARGPARLLALALAALFTLLSAPRARGEEQSTDLPAAFERLWSAPAGPDRTAAAEALVARSFATADLAARLVAPRTASTDDGRRQVLARFGADVPSPDGKFKTPPAPPRPKRGEPPPPPPPEPNWLGALAAMDAQEPAVKDSLEVVVLIRALAKGQDPAAAKVILDFTFTPDGVTFRDECGRALRAMSPWSLPGLLAASQDKQIAQGSYARYASYQLERLDKTRPAYALAAAPDAELEIAILAALGASHHPDAVPPVLDRCDSGTPGLRRAARAAWMQYVTGPPPPPAPKAKRKLPGGKMSDEELPLYLTYRELADQELRRRLIELGATPGKRDSAETLTQQLFSLWDDRRLKQWDEAMTQALALAGQSQWPEAAAAFDRILVAEPVYGRRAEMTPTFFALGQTLASAGQWEPASVAFEKAYSLDPTGPTSSQARAELHHARAKVLAQKGQPTDDELEQALAANPDHPGAKAALVREHKAAASQGGRWMLVAGAAALGLALGALLLALRRR